MKRIMIGLACSVVLMTGCMVQSRPGGGVEIIPILPAVVEVDVDSHYEQGGYHYYYDNDMWYYASTRGGQRHELPRSHWPREVHRHGWNR